jgi:hypothetical protein
MLWIGGQVTTLAIMKGVFLPSMVNSAGAIGGDGVFVAWAPVEGVEVSNSLIKAQATNLRRT